VVLGLAALAIGLVLDWQRLFPAIGDRIAAICALVVGHQLVASTKLGDWVQVIGSTVSSWAGQVAGSIDPQFTGPVSTLLVPLAAGVLAVIWMLAMIPSRFGKWVGTGASKQMSSAIIWAGTLLPVLAVSIPGNFGDFVRSVLGVATAAGVSVAGTVL
jgi:hypothetical protein